MGFGVWGLGFGVWGLGFGVWGLGFGVWSLGFGVWGLGYRRAIASFCFSPPLRVSDLMVMVMVMVIVMVMVMMIMLMVIVMHVHKHTHHTLILHAISTMLCNNVYTHACTRTRMYTRVYKHTLTSP